ncbi:hypothetical protein [Nocardia cyriacigeorgica]|uniref:hypothetical protein n=1 Tax=Nocardia cyriacigeorgica TaxID=135487 RepID=UPI0018938196|nr:hypothetical protein [Nocardia cyriacigeorgica]MBF6345712.1 hypothetical protein [Nocardia cyriacigeorgica]
MGARQLPPRRAAATDPMLKLHRRAMVLDGRAYTVLSLRPGTDFRFATNRFHETWHILSDWRGARVLARLLWGLSYQRRPGVLVLIDPAHLDPDPFDAVPSDPIVLMPSELTVLTRQAAAQLRRRLPLRDRSHGTVRWQSFGLDAAVAELAEWRRRWRELGDDRYLPPATGWERVERIGGLIVFAGSTARLREWAVSVATLGDYGADDMDYTFLDENRDGEVQIFRQYRRRVDAAQRARAEITAAVGHLADPADVQRLIWNRAAAIRRNALPVIDAG